MTVFHFNLIRFRVKAFWYQLAEAFDEDPFGFDPLHAAVLLVLAPVVGLSLLFLSAAVFSQTCRLLNCERTLWKNVAWYAPAPPIRRKLTPPPTEE